MPASVDVVRTVPVQRFTKRCLREPSVTVRAPGAVNLSGHGSGRCCRAACRACSAVDITQFARFSGCDGVGRGRGLGGWWDGVGGWWMCWYACRKRGPCRLCAGRRPMFAYAPWGSGAAGVAVRDTEKTALARFLGGGGGPRRSPRCWKGKGKKIIPVRPKLGVGVTREAY